MVGLEAVAIDDDGLRTYGKLVEGTVHSQDGGVEDVDFVDFIGCDNAYSPGHGITLNDFAQLFPSLIRQLFRIVKLLVLIVFREDDSSSIDATCQTTTSGFVAACFYLSFVIMTC